MNRKNMIASILLLASILTIGTAITVRATTNPALSYQSTYSSCTTSTTSTWLSTGFGASIIPQTTGRAIITGVAISIFATGQLNHSLNFELYMSVNAIPSCNSAVSGIQESIQIPVVIDSSTSIYPEQSSTIQTVQTGLSTGTTYYFYIAYQMIQGTPGGFGYGTILVQEA